MADTLQALQNIDNGDFEELAVFFLWRQHLELVGLVATGIDDESIACLG
jgi:hypothetical protein